MSSKSKEQVNSLLAAIQRKTLPTKQIEEVPVEPVAPAAPTSAPPATDEKVPKRATKKFQQRSGGPVNIWMQDEDRRLVRELSAWLAGQGVRTTDSMVIRAALRATKTGGAFLEACREISKTDGRLKQNQ